MKRWNQIALLIIISSLSSPVVAQNYTTGDDGIPPDYFDTIVSFFSVDMDGAGSFPVAFDWRDEGIVTPAKDQGSCGSCWAHTAAGVYESRIAMLEGPHYDLSEEQQVRCNSDFSGCMGGSMGSLRYYIKEGAMSESCAAYTASDGICSAIDHCHTLPYYLGNYYTVDANKVHDVQAALTADGPAYFRFDTYNDFVQFWNNASPGDVYTHSTGGTGLLGGHAVLLIGWDDNKQAWLLKNSWGANNGPEGDGTFWLAYSGHSVDIGLGMGTIGDAELDKNQYEGVLYPSGAITYKTDLGNIYKRTSGTKWSRIGSYNPATKLVVNSEGLLAALSISKKSIWKYDGSGTSWSRIDYAGGSVVAEEIIAGGPDLFKVKYHDGIYKWNGGTVWIKIGSYSTNTPLVVDGNGTIYALSSSKKSIWKYNGSPMSWSRIDYANGAKVADVMYAGGSILYKVNGSSIYAYDVDMDWRRIGSYNANTILAVSSDGVINALSNTRKSIWMNDGSGTRWSRIAYDANNPVAHQIYGGGDKILRTVWGDVREWGSSSSWNNWGPWF